MNLYVALGILGIFFAVVAGIAGTLAFIANEWRDYGPRNTFIVIAGVMLLLAASVAVSVGRGIPQ